MRSTAHPPTYRSWQMMKNRCLNPAATDYKYYGGRGIEVCAEWMTYDGFVSSMGLRPLGTTLERRDGAKRYDLQNCCWASRLTQSRNREYTLDLTFEGQTKKVWEWAAFLQLKPKAIHLRLWKHRHGGSSYASVFEHNPRTK